MSDTKVLWVEDWPCHVERTDEYTDTVPYSEREVDELLAERVLGWKRTEFKGEIWELPDGTQAVAHDFAHDIRAAMLLFEAVNKSPILPVLILFSNDATLDADQTWEFLYADDGIPAAIRLATLKALELQMQEAGK